MKNTIVKRLNVILILRAPALPKFQDFSCGLQSKTSQLLII